MPTPQPGIFAQGTRAHSHLEFDLRPDVSADAVASGLVGLAQPSGTAGGVNIVVGFGRSCWQRITAGTLPDDAGDLPEIPGVARTQHDLWVWIHGTGDDVLFDVARTVTAMLAPIAMLAAETNGFVYHDGRDLTGFIDGTENPPIEDAVAVATFPDTHALAGGSVAITQRWAHDLVAFHAQSVEEQECVIGRTKPDSIELADDVKPPTAHIARVVIEEDGEELEIYRRSVPYGTVTEHGLYFVAFSGDPSRFDKMLRRMFGAAGDGLHDRLTDFTRPVSGARYFVPSVETIAAELG